MDKDSIKLLNDLFLINSTGEKSRIIKLDNDKRGRIILYTASKQDIKDGICTKHVISDVSEVELPK